jgi:TetR/AcrR family transcriptional repressor of nem operon
LLVQRVLARYRDRTRQGLHQLSQLPGAMERLRGYVDYWDNCLRHNAPPFCICALLAAELPSLPEEVQLEVNGHFRDLADWLRATLETGAAAGELQLEQDAALEAQALMASVHGAMLAVRAGTGADIFAGVVGHALARLAPSAHHRPPKRKAKA